MRLSSIQWLLCTASSTVTAASAAAKVITFDTTSSSPNGVSSTSRDEVVEPDTARLILAQRLGLQVFHSVAGADEKAIRHINAYSSPSQQVLFGHEKYADVPHRLLVVVDGVDYDAEEETRGSIPSEAQQFSISPTPHIRDAIELFNAFSSEARSQPRTTDFDTRLHDVVSNFYGIRTKEAEYLDGHHAMLRFSLRTSESTHELNQAIKSLVALASSRPTTFTLMFVPPVGTGMIPSKTPFGLTKLHAKRDSKALRAPQEKPLISAAEPATESFTPPEPISPNFASSTNVLSGPIPTCFPSKDACQKTTNNCTSHGECILKWSTDTTNDGGSVSKQDCFGCACTKPEVRKNKDGTKKTTNFGGAACHKKDIVFPFWLLAGTTVGIIGVITFGLGLLYEMGNQELPSVIGAGVSGPKAGGR